MADEAAIGRGLRDTRNREDTWESEGGSRTAPSGRRDCVRGHLEVSKGETHPRPRQAKLSLTAASTSARPRGNQHEEPRCLSIRRHLRRPTPTRISPARTRSSGTAASGTRRGPDRRGLARNPPYVPANLNPEPPQRSARPRHRYPHDGPMLTPRTKGTQPWSEIVSGACRTASPRRRRSSTRLHCLVPARAAELGGLGIGRGQMRQAGTSGFGRARGHHVSRCSSDLWGTTPRWGRWRTNQSSAASATASSAPGSSKRWVAPGTTPI